MPKFPTVVAFDLAGETVTAAVRIRHDDRTTISVEPCAGRWMGMTLRVPVGAVTSVETPNVDRAFQRDAERFS
jgi:hypothetical protein